MTRFSVLVLVVAFAGICRNASSLGHSYEDIAIQDESCRSVDGSAGGREEWLGEEDEEEEDQSMLQTGLLHRVDRTLGVGASINAADGVLVGRASSVAEPLVKTPAQAAPAAARIAASLASRVTEASTPDTLKGSSCLSYILGANCCIKWASIAALCVLALYLYSRAQQGKESCSDIAPSEIVAAPVNEQLDAETGGAAAALLMQLAREVKIPVPRLAQVGTSFVVPWTQIASCGAEKLSIDIPVSPAVWPLRASFSRESSKTAWASIELTVDIIDAAGLPPLLRCMRAGGGCDPAQVLVHGDGTGGTGAPAEDNICAGSGESIKDDEGDKPVLEVRGWNGALAAVVVKRRDDQYFIQRPGSVGWDMELHLDIDDYWIAVRKKGQQVAVASRHSGVVPEGCKMSARVEHVKFDTHLDANSPESNLLFMIMLSTLVLAV